MPINTGPKQRVWVPALGMKYGFLMDQNSFTSFGQVLGIKDAASEGQVFYGANSPKPPRASKRDNGVTQSGFYDIANAKQLVAAGWRLSSSTRIKSIKKTGAAITVAVPTPFSNKDYAWNIPAGRKTEALALGASEPSDATKLVWGSFPKPPRATIRKADGTTFSTFCPPNQTAINTASGLGYAVEGLDGDWLNI